MFDELGHLRYIGKTYNLKERLKNHLKEKGRCHRISWLKSMKKKGIVPTILSLVEGLTENQAFEEEKFFIAYFRYIGADLTNGTDGGEGISGYRHTKETCAKMSKSRIGHSTSLETREKISAANRKNGHLRSGWHHKSETKKKLTGRIPRQIEDIDGNKFTSAHEAAIFYNVTVETIRDACRNPKTTHKLPKLYYAGSTKIFINSFTE